MIGRCARSWVSASPACSSSRHPAASRERRPAPGAAAGTRSGTGTARAPQARASATRRRRRHGRARTGAVEPKVYGTDWGDSARPARPDRHLRLRLPGRRPQGSGLGHGHVHRQQLGLLGGPARGRDRLRERRDRHDPAAARPARRTRARRRTASRALDWGAYPGSFQIVERDQGQRRPRREDGRRRLDGERDEVPRPERRTYRYICPNNAGLGSRLRHEHLHRRQLRLRRGGAARPVHALDRRPGHDPDRAAPGLVPGHDRERHLEPAVDRRARELHRPRRAADPARRRRGGGGGTTTDGGGGSATPATGTATGTRARERRAVHDGTIPFGATVDVTNGRLQLTTTRQAHGLRRAACRPTSSSSAAPTRRSRSPSCAS